MRTYCLPVVTMLLFLAGFWHLPSEAQARGYYADRVIPCLTYHDEDYYGYGLVRTVDTPGTSFYGYWLDGAIRTSVKLYDDSGSGVMVRTRAADYIPDGSPENPDGGDIVVYGIDDMTLQRCWVVAVSSPTASGSGANYPAFIMGQYQDGSYWAASNRNDCSCVPGVQPSRLLVLEQRLAAALSRRHRFGVRYYA